MDINKVQLTDEQKECVNFPLDKQVLIINAGPGTGKTEIIKERIKFIIEQSQNQKQLILILTFNKSISLDIWRKLKQLESKGVFFLKKTGEFSKRNVFSPFQIMNRTFHSLCYLIFSKEFEKISEKDFYVIPDKQKMAYSFPFWTDSTSNIVEFDKKKSSWKKLSSSDRLKFIIFGKLNKYVLQKKSNKVSQELKKALIGNKEILQKITIKKEEKPIVYQKIVYEEYLHKVHLVLEKSGRLDMYQSIKEFFLNEQRKNLWLSFDDLVTNVVNLLQLNEEIQKRWQIFDHILVDESQDLNWNNLTIIKLLRRPSTSLTFVGDPKQTIYGFRGSKSNIFDEIKIIFPFNIQKDITESFRSHKGIIYVVNDFSRKFLQEWHYTDLKSRKEGENPKVFFAKNIQEQIDFLAKEIDKIREPSRKAILFRENKTMEKLEEEFKKRNWEYVALSDEHGNKNQEIKEKLEKVKLEELGNISNMKDLIDKLNIQLYNPELEDLVENFDNNLRIERQWWREETELSQRQISKFSQELEELTFSRQTMNNMMGKIVLSTIHKSKGLEFDHVFLVDINEGILPSKKAQDKEGELEESRIFYVGITRARKKLYLCCSDQEKISRFIKELDSSLIEIQTTNNKSSAIITNLSSVILGKEEIGEEGEEKVCKLLAKSSVIFLSLIKNWELIPDLQIDIYAETTQAIYFIEVKNWSWEHYALNREKVLEQQITREQKINAYFKWKSTNKKITYIICFLYWKMAQDFRDFYWEIEENNNSKKEKLLFAFYEDPDEEFEFFADETLRVDEWIKVIEKKYDTK